MPIAFGYLRPGNTKLQAMMKIVIIGTGNTATVLGRKFKAADHTILQICGRDEHAASQLATELDAISTNDWEEVSQDADVYVMAVSDGAVKEVFDGLNLPANSILVHTAASVTLRVLEGKIAHYGVLYPLQTLKKEVEHLPDIPILIDANDKPTLNLLEVLALTVTDRVFVADDETRTKLHLAAVMVNNFTNHLYTMVEGYCLKENLDFHLLLPLIKETAYRLGDYSPATLQTGPAVRNDEGTIQKHLHLLQSYPPLNQFYQQFTESIRQEK